MQIVNDTKKCVCACVRTCVCVCVRKLAYKIEREGVSTVSTLLHKKKCHYIGSKFSNRFEWVINS